jgi:hypothetical protein
MNMQTWYDARRSRSLSLRCDPRRHSACDAGLVRLRRNFFYFKTARGRVNDHILRRHPRVGFDIQDPGNAYHYVLLQGSVVGETEENAVDWIQSLNEK